MSEPDELLTFIETHVFTRRVQALGLEAAVKGLQEELLANPEAGDVEPGTGGLRKVRLADPSRGKGKRGGARVHYLWLNHKRRIYLIFVYGKNEATALSVDQKRQLREIATKIREEQ